MKNKEINNLIKTLEEVFNNDQKYRISMSDYIDKYGQNSKEVRKLNLKIEKIDKENLDIVERIIKEYGWLSKSAVGEKASQALFLVIQHADIKVQKKYYPIIKKAAIEGKISSNNLALLTDRISVSEGKKQLYGTQVGYDRKTNKYFLFPVIDPEFL